MSRDPMLDPDEGMAETLAILSEPNCWIPEYVFESKWLDIFKKGITNAPLEIRGEWVAISGGPTAAVAIKNTDGKTVAIAPPMYNSRSLLEKNVGSLMNNFVEHADQESKNIPGMWNKLLSRGNTAVQESIANIVDKDLQNMVLYFETKHLPNKGDTVNSTDDQDHGGFDESMYD